MKTLAWAVLIVTGVMLGVLFAMAILGMIYLVATNADGAGMVGFTLMMAVIGLFLWALEKVKAPTK